MFRYDRIPEDVADVFIGIMIFKLIVLAIVGMAVLAYKCVRGLFRWLNETADRMAAEEAAKKKNDQSGS